MSEESVHGKKQRHDPYLGVTDKPLHYAPGTRSTARHLAIKILCTFSRYIPGEHWSPDASEWRWVCNDGYPLPLRHEHSRVRDFCPFPLLHVSHSNGPLALCDISTHYSSLLELLALSERSLLSMRRSYELWEVSLPLPNICLLLKPLVTLLFAMICYAIPRFNLSSVSRILLASSHHLCSTLQHITSHHTTPSRSVPTPPQSRNARTYLLANAFSQVGKQTRYTAREEQTKQIALPADWLLLRISSPSAGFGGLMARYKKMC